MTKKNILKIGDILPTTNHGNVKIINFTGHRRMTVEFLNTGHITTTNRQHNLNNLQDMSKPSVAGKGYIGRLGKPKTKLERTIRRSWYNMILRCYDPTNISYQVYSKNESVCDDWLHYNNFYNWYMSQITDKTIQYNLTKGVLNKHSNVYSPDTCFLIPHILHYNILYIPNYIDIHNTKPANVYTRYSIYKKQKIIKCIYKVFLKKSIKYIVTIRHPKTKLHTKTFDNLSDAFSYYKQSKEDYVKILAKKYYKDNLINKNFYDIMMNFSIQTP